MRRFFAEVQKLVPNGDMHSNSDMRKNGEAKEVIVEFNSPW